MMRQFMIDRVEYDNDYNDVYHTLRRTAGTDVRMNSITCASLFFDCAINCLMANFLKNNDGDDTSSPISCNPVSVCAADAIANAI